MNTNTYSKSYVEAKGRIGEIRVHENVEENQLQLFFPSKPSQEVRELLKSCGFHWSDFNKAWQRQLNNAARWTLESIKTKLQAQIIMDEQKKNGLCQGCYKEPCECLPSNSNYDPMV